MIGRGAGRVRGPAERVAPAVEQLINPIATQPKKYARNVLHTTRFEHLPSTVELEDQKSASSFFLSQPASESRQIAKIR